MDIPRPTATDHRRDTSEGERRQRQDDPPDNKRRRTGSGSVEVNNPTSDAGNANGNGNGNGNGNVTVSTDGTSARGKKPREQYSCVECFRRKQKCDRRFPCSNCIQRRLPERCVPPPGIQTSASVVPQQHQQYQQQPGTQGMGIATGYLIPTPGGSMSVPPPGTLPLPLPSPVSPPGIKPGSRMKIKPEMDLETRAPSIALGRRDSGYSDAGAARSRSGVVEARSASSTSTARLIIDRPDQARDDNKGNPNPRPMGVVDPALAETTARLARLERLLSLKDQGYAEKRLKLAEEAVLRILQVDDDVDDDEGIAGHDTYERKLDYQPAGRAGAIAKEESFKRSGSGFGSGYTQAQAQESRDAEDSVDRGGDDPDLGLAVGNQGMLVGDASSDAEGAMHDDGTVELLGDNGYNGATALAALSRAPVLTRVQTSSARNSYDDRSFLSTKNHLSGVSSSLDKLLDLTHFQHNEVRALFAVLPPRDVCETLIESYWREWDWTRCPLPTDVFPSDWRLWLDVDTFLRAHAKVLAEQGSNMMAALALVLSVLALGSVSPTLRSTDGHALSSAIFWAAIKALAFCQSPGSNDSRTMWARAILMRYGDLIRNTQMQWYMKSSWIANAMDQGFHRDGAGFGLAPEVTAERRVIWSHVLHADREWALVLGRPMQVNQYSTLMPTEADLAAWPWDYRQYLLARNELTPILERISTLFQELSLKRTPEAHSNGNFSKTDAHNDKTYQDLLTIDRTLDAYMAALPAHFSLDPTKTNDALERKYPRLKVYRQIIIAQVSFVRITMHRPFMLKALRKKKHPYRYSWQRCVDTAVQDLRARKMWTRTFNPSEQRQMFVGAWALFNSAVVLGLSILISVDMAEVPDPDTYQEYIGHLQECVETLQADLDQGRDDAVSRRERRIMDSLLARLDACTSAAAAGTTAATSTRPKVSPRIVETPQSGSITPTIARPPPRIPTESLVNVNINGIAPAIQFDPFLLQPFAQGSGMGTAVEGALLTDNQAFFNWEGFLSEMYCNDPIFP